MFGLIRVKKLEAAIEDVYNLCDKRSKSADRTEDTRYYDGAKSTLDFLCGYLNIKPAEKRRKNK